MCRHFLPRFDIPLGQAVHAVGRLVASHPAMTVAALLVPVFIALGVMLHHRLKRPAVSHLDSDRMGPRPVPAPGRLQVAHQP